MPPDVEKFFAAAEANNWPEVERLFTVLLAIPVFGERPSVSQMTGALAVIGAGLLLARSARPAVGVD